MNNERIKWIDISKGIGIFLVIIGHCVYIGGYAHSWIFSFHMQLFFILSGMFLKKDTLCNTIKKRGKQLLVPYFEFCIIGLIISLIIPQWRNISIKDLMLDLYWGYPNKINVSSIWFLMSLFMTTICFNVILFIQEKLSPIIGGLVLVVIITIGFLMVRVPSILAFFPTGRMPLNIDCSCVALLFFSIGYYFKAYIFNFEKKIRILKIPVKIVLLIVFVTLTIIFTIKNGTVNLHGLIYHNELLYVVEAFAGFGFVLVLSNIVSEIKIIEEIFAWLGINSLYIMGIQSILIRLYILLINQIFDEEFKLFFLPPRYAIVACIFVTVSSVVITFYYNFVKEKLRIWLQ